MLMMVNEWDDSALWLTGPCFFEWDDSALAPGSQQDDAT
jgi:hypothetical protein